MAEAEQTGLDTIPHFLNDIFYPKPLKSFRTSMSSGEITLYIHKKPDEEPQEIILKNMFPFMTLQDIKMALYVELKEVDEALPEFVYLAIHGSQPGKTFMGGGKTIPIDFTWNLPSLGGPTSSTFYNGLPFEIASGTKPFDSRFVESNGERKLVNIVNRERITIEDAFFKKGIANGLPEFDVYLYTDVLAAVPGPRPPSEKDWNGRLFPFFPYLSLAADKPTTRLKEKAARMSLVFRRRQQFLARLQSVLEDDAKLVPLTLAGVRFLRLTWSKRANIPGIETQFYEASVNERRPFMRFIPLEGTGISKVFLKDGINPDIQDPKMLVTWSQERSPTPEQDYAFAKILIRKGILNMSPIYSTLRLFNDGSADCILEPPKSIKKLEPRTDLESFGKYLIEGLKELPYIKGVPDIGNAILVLGIRMNKGDTAITAKSIRERLPIFTSFFQEIAPLTEEKPLIMLRFKLVSNFSNEDRIQTFITQVLNRRVIKGEALLEGITELVADEFQIDIAEARKQVAMKLQAQGEVALVNPDTKDYILQYNPGIDVAIFAQHPFYTFHLYRVDSLENLQRIVTTLSMMISPEIEMGDLHVGKRAADQLRTADGQPEIQETPAAPAATAATAAPAAPVPLPTEEVEEVGGSDEMPDTDLFDFFGAQDTGEQTLEEGHLAKQGTTYPEPPLPGQTPAPIESARVTVQEIKRDLQEEVVAPKEELRAPTAARPPVVAEEEEPVAEVGIANFFLNKLKEADRRLFDYTKSHPSLKRYVSKCQPTYGRQPAVLNEAQYEVMQNEYKDEIIFQEYPLVPGQPEKISGAVEKDYVTVLSYGTSKENQHRYICCRFFCTRDEMMILEKDLDPASPTSLVMRRPKGAPKKSNECPFCRGKIITNRRFPLPGQTILERDIIPKTENNRHLFIRFLKTTPHPDGWYLPCCFIDDTPVKFENNPAYDKYREWGIPPRPNIVKPTGQAAAKLLEGAEDEEEEQQQEQVVGSQVPRINVGVPILDYYTTLAGVTRRYIIGEEKMPLEIGNITTGNRGEPQIGLLPLELNPYFSQDQTQLVSRAFNPQKIKDEGVGFLRVAVENRVRYKNDSFLAAIAPFFLLNNADQLKALIKEKLTPRVFLALNYGNLAIEFYNPADSPIKRPSSEELATWASTELDIDISQETYASIERAYMSYTYFMGGKMNGETADAEGDIYEGWLMSKDTKKEFRHFALMFAQSNLMRRGPGPGITFIVLDILKSGKVTVRCPPYGYNADLMSGNDIGFLLHHWSGIWEPIFYVDARSPEQRGIDIFTLLFQVKNSPQWHPILRQRLQEYTTQCGSSGRAAYTSQSKINPLSMIPLSIAQRLLRKVTEISVVGIVRDAYNHVAALLFREKASSEPGYIPLPVVDDGELITNKKIMMDWDDPAFVRAPASTVIQFYQTYIQPRFGLYPGFVPDQLVSVRSTGGIEAIQLKNGLYIPVAPPSAEGPTLPIRPEPMDVLEWSLNHEISLEGDAVEVPGEKSRIAIAEFQEIFEHLRVTFSNWLATKDDGGEFRSLLEETIYTRSLPLFEKRKRLEIWLKKPVSEWITTDYTDEDKQRAQETSLLRVDCRSKKDKEGCAGKCVWRQTGSESGKCLLHVPETTELGEEDKKVSAPRILLLRLIEELLRYGERRRQLLDNDVGRLASFEKPITIEGKEGKQRIYPEKSAAWFELLRLDWATKAEEEPKFYEELSRTEVTVPPPIQAPPLPPSLITILNGGEVADPKTNSLHLFRGPLEMLFAPLALTPAQLSIEPDTSVLTDNIIRDIVRIKAIPFVQINLVTDPPTITAKRPPRPTTTTIPVFVITTEGPALLIQDPNIPRFLKKDEMPKGLVEIVDKAKSVLMTMTAKAKTATVAKT